MNSNSKKTSLVVLAVTAIASVRGMLALINDPEGPNLLVTLGMSAVLYLVSLTLYLYYPSIKAQGVKRVLLMILIQVGLVAGLYTVLK